MANPGPARTPNLRVVKEGNPHGRPQEELDQGVRLKAHAPEEPDWLQWFPAVRKPTKAQLELLSPEMCEGMLTHIENDEKRERLARAKSRALIAQANDTYRRTRKANQRARDIARAEWRRVVPILDTEGLLAQVDNQVLVDYCLCVARIDQCERDISEEGHWVKGERGAQKNPSTTIVNQYRGHLRFYVGELGLTPVARDKLNPGGDDDGDSPFD